MPVIEGAGQFVMQYALLPPIGPYISSAGILVQLPEGDHVVIAGLCSAISEKKNSRTAINASSERFLNAWREVNIFFSFS
jgi:hypothetical protein